MQIDELVTMTEAALFASGEPMDGAKLAQALETEEDTVPKIIRLLNDRLEASHSSLCVLELDGEYQMTVRSEYSGFVKKALETKRNTALSPAAMEVLTIVAYNQPVTKSFVENVRGVDSSSTVNSLVEKGLLAEAGRLDLPGRPIAYKTTSVFLRCFQLSSTSELPEIMQSSEQMSIDEIIENAQQPAADSIGEMQDQSSL